MFNNAEDTHARSSDSMQHCSTPWCTPLVASQLLKVRLRSNSN